MKMPRPEGHIQFSYSPMSPPQWGIVPNNEHTFVYPNIRVALQALLQGANAMQAKLLESGVPEFLSDHLYFRGQSEITHRLLPSRLRGSRRETTARQRFRVDDPPKIVFNGVEFPSRAFNAPPGEDPRDHFGDWYEEVKPMRTVEASLAEVPDDELLSRDERASIAIQRASQISAVERLTDFQKRATVKHYSGVESALLDVSTDPEVAAFFATGAANPPPVGQIGMLWCLDLNLFTDVFSFEVSSEPGGLKIRMVEKRSDWGDNKRFFEEHGVLPVRPEIFAVELPFRRPQAQKARFIELTGENGSPLPPFTELTWWSIIERRAYTCAFIQDGNTYEKPSHNLTRAALLPTDEELAIALASGG